MNFDVYMVGVGGQGVLTIGDILVSAAKQAGIPANFYPTKGMAQRGGFVKAQLRLGRQTVGPQIPESSADLVIAMELSEALRAVRFARVGGDFLLFGHVWHPTAVMLGKAPYPKLEEVQAQIKLAGARLHYVDPAGIPSHEGAKVADNVYVLGAAMACSGLQKLFGADAVAHLVTTRWRRGAESNRLAFEAGLRAGCSPSGSAG